MFCFKCGKEIDDSAVVCVHCGVATKNMQKDNPNSPPIIINNSSSSSASAAASSSSGRVRRRRSVLFDIFMFFITGGLWLIWIILRPKYY